MIIYLDCLFIKEFLMNCVILYSTSKIIGNKIKIIRIIYASLIAAIYTIICLLYPLKLIILGRVICTLTITLIAFECKTIIQILSSNITFYITTFIFTGILNYANYNYIKTITYITLSTIFITKLIKKYKEKYKLSNYIITLTLKLDNEEYQLKTLIDTGNELISDFGEDVIAVSPQVIKMIKNKKIKELLLEEKINEEMKSVFRIIKYKSLGNKYGIKYGIKIENLRIEHKERMVKKSAVIISSDSNFELYDAIVGLNILETSNGETLVSIT